MQIVDHFCDGHAAGLSNRLMLCMLLKQLYRQNKKAVTVSSQIQDETISSENAHYQVAA